MSPATSRRIQSTRTCPVPGCGRLLHRRQALACCKSHAVLVRSLFRANASGGSEE